MWKERGLIHTPKNYLSNQLCSCYGYKNKEVKNQSFREWTGSECNGHQDKVLNVSINLRKLAM
nr:hypothetical protein [Bacillus cereus]